VDDFASIARLIEAIRPWSGDLVIIGGWAHRLYRFHPQASSPAYQAVQTRDADVAFSLDAQLKGDIAAALRKAGFREDFRGEDAPPLIQYRLGDEDQGFYAEFLTSLRGSGVKRDGTPDATLAKAGVTAQKLRHLDLLLIQTWTVRLDSTTGVPLAAPAEVRVANPVCFIAQKLLIRNERSSDKQAQDVLYIHDTLELFGSELESLRAEWREKIRPAALPKTAATVERLYREQFGAVNDVIRTAARIPQDRTLTPDRLQAACSYGLEAILGADG
jgi:hypothetical protein